MSLPCAEVYYQKIEMESRELQSLPPTSLTETMGIHFAHIAHSDDADGGIFLGEDHIECRIEAVRARLSVSHSRRLIVSSTR